MGKKFIFEEQEEDFENILERAEKEEVKPESETSEREPESVITEGIPYLSITKKETRSVKKMILIRPSLNTALKQTAVKYGLSENEVINQLLERYYWKTDR